MRDVLIVAKSSGDDCFTLAGDNIFAVHIDDDCVRIRRFDFLELLAFLALVCRNILEHVRFDFLEHVCVLRHFVSSRGHAGTSAVTGIGRRSARLVTSASNSSGNNVNAEWIGA